MSYIYMKSLENKAERYDKGINTLTLGKYPKIKQYIADNYLYEGENLLDIGMGTGTLAILAANKGLDVTGIDYSEKMLNVARRNIKERNLSQQIKIKRMSIINLDKEFKNKSFDKVTAMLIFSELYEKEQDFTLDQIYRILKDTGEFILVDEVKPKALWKKILYFIIKVPLVVLTFLKSQLTTKALNNFENRLEKHRFDIISEKYYLLDTLKLLRIKKRVDREE
ncbi:MAG: corrinoid protein-associated methyltransferase CpaM [Candidatus Thorarchaeota archaeon]